MKSFQFLNPRSSRAIFMSCEHASRIIPKRYNTFGIKRKDLDKNPDWYDVGAEGLAKVMARKLNARCILSSVSRMVVNLNKPAGHPKLMNAEVFGLRIPGNERISSKDRNYRLKNYYYPYHNRLKKEISELRKRHKVLYYVGVHTFFHINPEGERKLDIGILYRYPKDRAFCSLIKKILTKKTKFKVDYNKPYSAFKTAGYTLNKYGKAKNIRCVEFEVNDKHARDAKSIKRMGKLLSSVIEGALRNSL